MNKIYKLLVLALFGCSTLTNAQVSTCQPYRLSDIPAIEICNLNGFMLVVAEYDGLWKSDGTTEGTIKINAAPNYITGFGVLGNTAFFKSGLELWKTDGTEAGTVMVEEFPNATFIGKLVPAGNLLFFLVHTGFVNKLWKTDGTAAGTSLVMDIDPSNSVSWDPRQIFAYQDHIYFKAGNSTYGSELWKSDGTEGGTMVVRDIDPGSGNGVTTLDQRFGIYNDELYFSGGFALSGELSYGLWKTDGTDAGTMLIKEAASVDRLTTIDGILYFYAVDFGGLQGNSLYGEELWRSDGTNAGTHMVKDILPGSGSGVISDSELENINGKIVFGASDGTIGTELWVSDGTEAGTQLLKDVSPGTQGGVGNYFGASDAINGYIYFSVNDGTAGAELWATDGTSSGTFLVSDIWPGLQGSGPTMFHVFNGNLYFSLYDQENDRSFWTCGNFSGIEDALHTSPQVYPNPATNSVTFRTQNGKGHYQLHDITGKSLLQGPVTATEQTIDISALSRGVYTITIKNGDESLYSKIIKN